MAGAGNWQNLLPDEASRHLYARLYPNGITLSSIPDEFDRIIAEWQEAGIATIKNERLVPLGPIIQDRDIEIMTPWFEDTSQAICQTISRHLADYQELAVRLCGDIEAPVHKIDNLITILVCAQALDVWTFQILRQELIGPHPPRGQAGRFFFWGYAFTDGPKRIFGVTTYGRGETVRLSVLRSHGLDRGEMPALLRESPVMACIRDLCLPHRKEPTAYLMSYDVKDTIRQLRTVHILEPDEPLRLAIPVFHEHHMEKATLLHYLVASEIADYFTSRISQLQSLIFRCSFAHCSMPDVLAMIFHLAYSYAADTLVAAGTIPDFPQQAGGEWGVWLNLIGGE